VLSSYALISHMYELTIEEKKYKVLRGTCLDFIYLNWNRQPVEIFLEFHVKNISKCCCLHINKSKMSFKYFHGEKRIIETIQITIMEQFFHLLILHACKFLF